MRTAILTVVVTCLGPAPAFAQFDNRGGFFAPLLSLFGGRSSSRVPQFDDYRTGGDSYRQRGVPQITVRPRPTGPAPETNDHYSERALGSRSFCVRLCDGFYFPVGQAAGGKTAQAQSSTCTRMCPAAEVALYSLPNGGEVNEAIGPRGRRYSALGTAFRFRTELSPSCTCNGRPGGGLAAIDIADDFTLRRGDLIAGEIGPLAFSGGGHLPFKSAQFTPATSRQLGQEMMLRFVRGASPAPATSTAGVDPNGFEAISEEPVKPNSLVRVVPLSMASSATE
jgi:hypothetical protein